MGKKKKHGHFCIGCGMDKPNEKFSGKGHRQHICKACKRAGKTGMVFSTSEYDREMNRLTRAIRKCMILYTERMNFFLFEYKKELYITREEFDSEIFVYRANRQQDFIVSESLYQYESLLEVLYSKYYTAMENGQSVEYAHLIEEDDDPEITLTQKQRHYKTMILSINNLE